MQVRLTEKEGRWEQQLPSGKVHSTLMKRSVQKSPDCLPTSHASYREPCLVMWHMHLPLTQSPSLRDRPIGKTQQRKLRLTFYTVICGGNQAFKGRKKYRNKQANKTVFYKEMRFTIFSNKCLQSCEGSI